MDKRILIADDEPGIADAVAYAFRREGFEVQVAHDGEEALLKAAAFRPQVMILDVMMPKLSGYDVCRKLENRRGVGIMLLTAKNDIVDKVLGLEFGADDYITKPFDLRELIARAKALMRRVERTVPDEPAEELALGAVRIHPAQRSLYVDGKAVDLTPKEFDLIALLFSHPDRVYSREQLLDLVWGMDYAGGTRTVDIHIQRLRKKLGEPHQQLIHTVYGVGYKVSGDRP